MEDETTPAQARGWLGMLLLLVLLALALVRCSFEGETCGRARVRFPAGTDTPACVCPPPRCIEPGPTTDQR